MTDKTITSLGTDTKTPEVIVKYRFLISTLQGIKSDLEKKDSILSEQDWVELIHLYLAANLLAAQITSMLSDSAVDREPLVNIINANASHDAE